MDITLIRWIILTNIVMCVNYFTSCRGGIMDQFIEYKGIRILP